jgi:phospholipid/cholesterol/gamma-HCH transport system permease protein
MIQVKKNKKLELPSWTKLLLATILLAGQVLWRLLKGRIHKRNTIEQMWLVGPGSLSLSLVTAAFVGMVFTIQVAREFIYFGAVGAVGGVLSISLARELAPVLTSLVIAGRVGSAFAAEIGTMKVTEQIDALYVLKTDPVDYLVTPRFLACVLMLPLLTIMSLLVGLTSGVLIAKGFYNIEPVIFIRSSHNFLRVWDIISAAIKAGTFGGLIAIIGCSWGLLTTGGAKGVGQSTTSAVVVSTLAVFAADFLLDLLLFQGTGQANIN